jgi:outer membrane protein OmpA-like peptidoglycan-associated protein
MAINLLDACRNLITPDVVSKISSLIGETPAKTQQALGTAVPTIAGVACNAASTPGGASKLFDLIRNTQIPADAMTNAAGLLAGGAATQGLMRTGSGLISNLLGDRAGAVASLIANASGIQQSSASTLLSLAAPLFFAVIGRHVISSGMGASSLSSILSSHRDGIMSAVPGELGNALGLNDNSNLCGPAPAPAARPVAFEESEKKGFPIWGWLLPLVLIGIGLLAWRSCSSPQGLKMASISLPCGTVLSVQEGMFTYNVANFMMKGAPSDLPKQFVFDHLNFDSGTTRLTPDSNQTVTDLTAIMKCFPNMAIQLEGHTDSTGDPEANKKLSVDRAEAVKALMVSGGVNGDRISTSGWGDEKPIAPNDSEEGKAKNRRTELIVTKK